MNYSEANIQIEDINFSKRGEIIIQGIVENVPLVYRVDTGCKEFEKFLPKDAILEFRSDFEYMDSEGSLNATTDDFFNIHWHLKIGGNVISRTVHMEGIAKEILFNLYINTQ